MNNGFVNTKCNNNNLCALNRNISVNGIKKCIVRKNYYSKYYNRINSIYIVDYKDKNGKFCYRGIYIVPRVMKCEGKRYLGSSNRMVKYPNK